MAKTMKPPRIGYVEWQEALPRGRNPNADEGADGHLPMLPKDPPHWRLFDRPRLKVQFQYEPRDWWVGIFWRRTKIALHVYVCLIPLVPLHITVRRKCCANAPTPGGNSSCGT